MRYTANGYAFFDHVTIEQFAPIYFDKEIENVNSEREFENPDVDTRKYFVNDEGTSMYYSESGAEYLAIDSNGDIMSPDDAGYSASEIGSFDNGWSGWTAAEGSYGGYAPNVNVFNGEMPEYGIIGEVPYSPNGANDRVFSLSTYEYEGDPEKGHFKSEAIGYKSDYFNVNRYKNYRVSIWAYGIGENVASAAISGFDYKGANNELGSVDYGKGQLRVESESVSSDSSNTTRNGWKEIAFYLKGSSFTDYKVRVELWLGKKSAAAQGVALFDNVRIEEITAKEYTDYSGNGKSVSFDPAAATSSITNNEFDNIEAYDDYSLQPFTPSGWTLMTAGEDETTGMSTNVNDEDYRDWFVSGVVSSEAKSYKYEKSDGNYLEGAINPNVITANDVPSNLLMMKADDTTGVPQEELVKGGVAVGYRSTSFSISSNTVQQIDVKFRAIDIGGYGANLVLKNGTNVIASIEKIYDTDGFETYSFYVQTGSTSLSEVYVEIWLGLYDDNNNTEKLATGTLFVENVNLTNLSEGDDASNAGFTYTSKYAQYEAAMRSGEDVKLATYSNSSIDFSAFDRYSDDFIKKPYGFSENVIAANAGSDAVVYGVFNAQDYNKESGELPEGYKHKNAINKYSLLVKNVAPASSRIKCDTNFSLASGSYYAITVLAKVDIPTEQIAENYKGAYIGIVDTEHSISDIKTTATTANIYDEATDSQSYVEFKFYVRTAGELAGASEEGSTSSSNTADTVLSLEFGVGGSSENRDEWAVGSIMVNAISVEQCSNAEFETLRDELNAGAALTSRFNAIADYGDEEEEEEEDTTTNTNLSGDNWYVYMTVILAVVLLIVLIAVAVRYFALKKKREHADTPDTTPSYDRSKTLVRQHNARAGEEETVELEGKDVYDTFDEEDDDYIYDYDEEVESVPDTEEAPEVVEDVSEATEEAPETEAEEVAENAEEAIEEAPSSEEVTETTETTEATEATEESPVDEEYTYSEEIVDFTPSDEKRKELEEKRAEAERIKAEKAAAKKRAEEERAKAEKEKREANRNYNDWDKFDK